MDRGNRKFLYQKRANGSTYVYEVLDHHWDKEKKQARTKQVYVGKLDPATGKIIPKKRLGDQAGAAMNEAVTARTTISGPALVLKQADRSVGLSKHLKRACPHRWQEILSLVWYLLGTNAALSHAETWCESHEVPSPKRFSSQRITELLVMLYVRRDRGNVIAEVITTGYRFPPDIEERLTIVFRNRIE